MTGNTHKQYAICGAFIAAIIIHKLGLSEVNYYLALIILLLTAKKGAIFPDIDHDWRNVKDKTVISWLLNKLIHLTNGKHRSWQTHSIDIVALGCLMAYFLPDILYTMGKISLVNKEVTYIVTFGFMSGWVSHIVSDMLTSSGVRLTCVTNFKVSLVPKSIGSLRFNTGNEWEQFNFKGMKFINLVLGFICLVYPIIPYSGLISSIKNLQIGG